MDEGPSSFPNYLCSAGPTKPEALCTPPSPTASPPAGCGLELSRHLGMPGPGGWGQTFSSLSLKAQRSPQGMVTETAGGQGLTPGSV